MPAWFGPDLLQFLRDLAENNDRAWFETNKARYDREVKEPALRFITAFAEPLRGLSPHYQAIARAQGGSLFRIHRDTRFGADKRPYKTNTGLHFRHEAGKDAHAPGFYLHIEPGQHGVGIGCWMPEPEALGRIRAAILARPERWAEVRAAVTGAGLAFMTEDALKRPPRGVPADHPHVDDLRNRSFAVWAPLSDAQILAPDLMDRFTGLCRAGLPLAAFLCEAQDLPC